jgi:hypothetical protein
MKTKAPSSTKRFAVENPISLLRRSRLPLSRLVQPWCDSRSSVYFVELALRLSKGSRTMAGVCHVFTAVKMSRESPSTSVSASVPSEESLPSSLVCLTSPIEQWPSWMVTGLRASEILAMTWERLNLEEGTMLVSQGAVNGRIGPCKTEDSADEVPLHPDLVSVLMHWRICVG